MARDLKYGEVTTTHGEFLEDEPVVVFRGRDELLPQLMEMYLDLCLEAGSPTHHLKLILDSRERIKCWQEENPFEVKTPTSDAYLERITGRS
jgi:hypothetical protein